MNNKTITLAREREAFEAWFLALAYGSPNKYDLAKLEDGSYRFASVRQLESCWQARAAVADPVPPVSDGDRHLSVLALHDVMQSVPSSSLYSLAEAVLDAGYTKGSDPVPPAGGEPEVVGWRSPDGRCITDTGTRLLNCDPLIRLSDHRAHVTRLQAEVEQWRASNKANALAAGELVAALQSELTKARELLLGSHAKFRYISEGGKFYLSTAAEGMRLIHLAALSNQSAPADKAPPLIQALHANGDRIAMEATIAQQAQRISDLEADKGQGEPAAWIAESSEPSFYLSGSESTASAVAEHYREKGFEASVEPLYRHQTVQPAPVAVVMPELRTMGVNQEYNRGCRDALEMVRRNLVKQGLEVKP